jgi:hypothetical protein
MPFSSLVNAQQVEVVVAGPGDVNRLYLCKGVAQGNSSINVQPNQFQTDTDTWQFHVGPHLDVTQFRRAIATLSFAGLAEQESSGAWVNYNLQTFDADFDDDNGMVKVSVTNSLSSFNPGSSVAASTAITQLTYDVTILAAM